MRTFRHQYPHRAGGVGPLARTVLAILPILLAGCSPRQDLPALQDQIGIQPLAQESWDITLDISERGMPRLKIIAWHMQRYDDPDSLFTVFTSRADDATDRVTATFFDSTGVENGSLVASSIRFNRESEQLVATGEVLVTTTSGRRLETELLHWDQKERHVRAPGQVLLETEDERISGFELEADENLDNYVIRRISGTVVVKE